MDYNFTKALQDEASERTEPAEISDAREIFEKLLVTTTESIGFPRGDLAESAIKEGIDLTKEFLKVSNPQTRRLIVDLVEKIAALNAGR